MSKILIPIVKPVVMEEIVLIFITDNWHSHTSKDLIGTAIDIPEAIELIKEYCDKLNIESLTETDLHNLVNIKQTQGYENEDSEFNLQVEPIGFLC